MADVATITGTPEEAGLELARWGTRFVERGSERAYLEWNALRAVAFIQLGLLSSIASWVALSAVSPIVAPTRWPEIVASVWLGVMPMIAACLVMSRVPRWRGLMMPTAAATSTAAGLCLIWCCALAGLTSLSVVGCVVNAFVAFAVFRVRPLQATVAALIVLTLDETWITQRWLEGSASTAEWAGGTVALFAALQTGVLTCVLLDRVARESFRQERIIEAQKATIARERARSEALLKQELSHQIAERSRELGAVLAKSDVTSTCAR